MPFSIKTLLREDYDVECALVEAVTIRCPRFQLLYKKLTGSGHIWFSEALRAQWYLFSIIDFL